MRRVSLKNPNLKIAVLGLGYVGLPLAVEFGKKLKTVGYDVSEARLSELLQHHDSTGEVSEADIKSADNLIFTSNILELEATDIFIVTVPTPIDEIKI